MSKNNTVTLHGAVVMPPKIWGQDDTPVKASFALKVIKRPLYRDRMKGGGKLQTAFTFVVTTDPELIEIVSELCVYDIVSVKGVLTVREVDKPSVCGCGCKNTVKGNIVYVIPSYLRKCESGHDYSSSHEVLKKNLEISNDVLLIGNLCRDPEAYTAANGKIKTAQYQIAVNRKYRLEDNSGDEAKTDYIWVKSSGKQAETDARKLRKGSLVFIDGAIATRDITRKSTCKACDTEYEWRETVTEIQPYSVEYVRHCNGEPANTPAKDAQTTAYNNSENNVPEYDDILSAPHGDIIPPFLKYYSAANKHHCPIRLNPCKIPHGIMPQQWADILVEQYSKAYGLSASGKRAFEEAVYNLYNAAGVFDDAAENSRQEAIPVRSSTVTLPKIRDKLLSLICEADNPSAPLKTISRDAYSEACTALAPFGLEFTAESLLFGDSRGLSVSEFAGMDNAIGMIDFKGTTTQLKRFILGMIKASGAVLHKLYAVYMPAKPQATE